MTTSKMNANIFDQMNKLQDIDASASKANTSESELSTCENGVDCVDLDLVGLFIPKLDPHSASIN